MDEGMKSFGMSRNWHLVCLAGKQMHVRNSYGQDWKGQPEPGYEGHQTPRKRAWAKSCSRQEAKELKEERDLI